MIELRQGPSPTRAPAAWASVRLIEGQSSANFWHVDGATSKAQLAVGTAETCAWQVNAAGVAHVHFELWWDGRRLWIADTRGAGGVTVDGAPLGDWQQVPGRARIEFGRAVMLAESSMPAVTVSEDGDRSEPLAHEADTLIVEAPQRVHRHPEVGPGLGAPTIILPAVRRPVLDREGFGFAHAATPAPGPPAAIPRRAGLSVPPRTWLLIGATCAALTFVLLTESGEDEPDEAATAADLPRPEPAAPSAVDLAPPVEEADQPGRLAPVEPVAIEPARAASGSERQAAELLAAGRQREALAIYDELARSRPDDRVFSAIVVILKRRLAARCSAAGPGGPPCADSP